MPSQVARHLKNYFIPHEGNNFHPHVLHPKRAFFYSLAFVAMKAIVVLFAVLLPAQVFILPDILAEQYNKIITLTNNVRRDKGLTALTVMPPLNSSANAKAADMAENHYFSHVGPRNRALGYFLSKAGYRYQVAGENLAMGFTDADSVVNAWIKSPSHYRNLIDTDYEDLGVGLISGEYNGQPTVFVAQHFGALSREAGVKAKTPPVPKVTATSSRKELAPTSSVLRKVSLEDKKSTPATSSLLKSSGSALALGASSEVQGEKVEFTSSTATSSPTVTDLADFTDVTSSPIALVALDKSKSHVFWFETEGKTTLQARAVIAGDISSAVVYVSNYPIELARQATTSLFVGKLTINEPVDTFFRPVIMPAVTITSVAGEQIEETIDWYNIKVVEATPLDRYFQAKKLLSPLTHIFGVSRGVYLGFIIFFSVALLVNIVVEFRKQHYHVIIQTLFMLALLVWLWWV